MTDDRSLERAARSWIESGPTQAPDRAVESALLRIESTAQERDLRIPWRDSRMNPIFRSVGVAAVAVLAIGIGLIVLRPGSNVGVTPSASGSASPFPSATTSATTLAEYRSARDAVCNALMASPIPDPTADVTIDRAGTVTFLHAVIARGEMEASQLEAIDAPAEIATEHLANVQTLRDVLALISREIDHVNAGELDEARTVDQATGSLSHLFEQFEAKYSLAPCP